MSEFGESWKHQNNTACTKSFSSLQIVEIGHYSYTDEEKKNTGCSVVF